MDKTLNGVEPNSSSANSLPVTAPRLARTKAAENSGLRRCLGTDCHLFWRLARFCCGAFRLRPSRGTQFCTPPPTTGSFKYCKQQSQKWRRSILAILAASRCWWRMQTSINRRGPAAPQVCGPTAWHCMPSTARTSCWSLRHQHGLALLHLHCPSRPCHYHRRCAAAGTGYADVLSSRRTLLVQPAG